MSDDAASTNALTFTTAASVALLLVLIFKWSIIDAVTPFLFLPVIALAWLFVLAGVIWSLIHCVLRRRDGLIALAPLLICACAILAAIFVPFTQIWLFANFHIERAARERVVTQVQRGQLLPNVSYNNHLITLPGGLNVTAGGRQIMVQGKGQNSFVLFFTYRGVLDAYSGFLWVPTGRSPRQYKAASGSGAEVVPYGGNWYFVGHSN